MITLTQLNALPDTEFVAQLGGLYEHSDWVPQRVLPQRPFPNVEILRNSLRQVVNEATAEEQFAQIRGHPDLAGKLARGGELTAASTREQAGLGLDRLSDDEYEIFSQRNKIYQAKFGFPFIICARLTTKYGVLDAFASRLDNSREVEISEAMRQIHEIARLRLADTVGGG